MIAHLSLLYFPRSPIINIRYDRVRITHDGNIEARRFFFTNYSTFAPSSSTFFYDKSSAAVISVTYIARLFAPHVSPSPCTSEFISDLFYLDSQFLVIVYDSVYDFVYDSDFVKDIFLEIFHELKPFLEIWHFLERYREHFKNSIEKYCNLDRQIK